MTGRRIEFPLRSVWRLPDGEIVRVTGVSNQPKRHLTSLSGHLDRWVRTADLAGAVAEAAESWEAE